MEVVMVLLFVVASLMVIIAFLINPFLESYLEFVKYVWADFLYNLFSILLGKRTTKHIFKSFSPKTQKKGDDDERKRLV